MMFFASTDRGSAAHTQPAVASILRTFFPSLAAHMTPEQIGRVDWNLRKLAHVTEYTILGCLLYRALNFGRVRFHSRNVLGTYLIGVAWAASDEWHQSFVRSRTASGEDVFFDMTGVLIGLVLCLWAYCVRREKSTPSNP